ncbi:hypothetical protein ZIOFF_007770 [Zingiber officinale]|uniref:Uncharacterized protein n=1 Tax=Zingiber officinale TaxID=94328 RepID=A0A8J5LWR1_ZINOF|nr:hypothetical protein ZIOFF_007770 [Zingiber officinale]
MLGKLGHSIGPILKSFSINPSGGSGARAATMASFAVTLLLRRVPSLRGARALSVALPWRWYSSLSRDSDSDSTVAFSYGSESGSDESSTPLREKEIMKDIEPIRTLAKDILHSKRYRDGESLNAEDEKEITEKILHYHPHSEDKIGCGLSSIVVYLNIVLFTFAIMNSVVARATADEEATNSTYEHYVPVLLFHKVALFFFLQKNRIEAYLIFFVKVDRHPEFRYSRCLFVARTDGDLVDFSYNKCLKTYIRSKYPSHAEWFIRKHFGRK